MIAIQQSILCVYSINTFNTMYTTAADEIRIRSVSFLSISPTIYWQFSRPTAQNPQNNPWNLLSASSQSGLEKHPRSAVLENDVPCLSFLRTIAALSYWGAQGGSIIESPLRLDMLVSRTVYVFVFFSSLAIKYLSYTATIRNCV